MVKHVLKVVSILLCVVMLLFATLTGCSSTSNDSEAPVSSSSGNTVEDTSTQVGGKITFVAGNDTTGAVKKNVEEFKKLYPNIEVDFQQLPGNSDDVKKGIMAPLAASDTDPDVFSTDIIWLSQFASAGWLLDVTQDLEAMKDKYVAGPLSTCYFNDKAYGFPDYTDVGLLYYRSDIIKEPPKTWDELVEMSKANIGKNGIEYGFIYQAFQGEPVVCNALEFIKQNGGNDFVNGKFVINSPNSVEALKFMRSLIDDDISPEGVLTHKPDDSRAIFEEGKALFMRNWTYAYAPSQADTSKVKGKVGVAPLPIGPKGEESSGTLGGWNIAINSHTDNKDAALLFAKFISDETAQKNRTIMASTFPTLKTVYDDNDVQQALPYLKSVMPATEQAKPRPQVPDYPAISSIMQIYLHKALMLEMPYEEALAQMTKELEAAYAKQ
ncbi:ABC transporter substrate-binding protein [Mahella australiensis]|uniref:Extracellular solute-binding protein family 1 n=1 Tax=Mahella australiensis (strain DSM 15567 / CIP 107919 / 50-1 BON) TaxID=697281 RepID=F3ZZ55_MAHA5|nr:ABC transporter substrate-binding protein [Mahella australiensis]AEE97837.1 extracellular solute-binding protein family 1 [Mahella australiensis 50-1 BON]